MYLSVAIRGTHVPLAHDADLKDAVDPDVLPRVHMALVPQLPGTTGATFSSWLGGSPALPEGEAWPMIAGQPAQFLAQIDCTALPDTLWQGIGPRRGWLVFFRATGHEHGALPVRVLHVEGRVTTCPPPMGQHVRPRWPLLIQAAAEQGLADTGAGPQWGMLHDVDLALPGYQPFDWTSAEMLLECLMVRTGGAAWRAEDTNCHRVADGLARLRADFDRLRTEETVFEEVAPALLSAALALVSASGDCKCGCGGMQTQLRQAARAYFAPFERHCRQIYAGDPRALPPEQRALFEPFWAHNARHETGSIGADDVSTKIGAEVLLELPSSELLGWMFGEARALRIFLTAEDLAEGRLDRAWGSVAA
ncbi:DUF1963 domain-containing protein [Sedimentitalea sp. XS_ASV28]|uniref:DUF1963 domain-containing protein n=1 Tax=Sedimentitalea sp. XS_ASV28 TaxID=3241296 RepID=UPI0035166331